jgi:hypothetical protein
MGQRTYEPSKSKYTRELMEPIVRESVSYYEVFKRLGLKPTGSANSRIREIVARLRLDTSHFLGRSANCGDRKRGGPDKLDWQDVLVFDRFSGRKEKASILRRALVESGVAEECEECRCGPSWNGKPLRLQVDHRNGNCLDNRPGNPRFLCPNCHSQTETFGCGSMTKTTGKKPWAAGRTKKRVWKDGKRIYV